ncbi:MAG: VIT1/CCC1 transporter family protein [Anaerolineae bacterium]|nr:VIT1/CCC1 transporter family protein [Anaerolineae bacterium]MCX8067879.1 VIT1/CCC1 transporter family protein [Anaerolineae bacterium]MDW7990759.1 VIT1/CCC1 transporter family protein [Anaerolineae bacterium]
MQSSLQLTTQQRETLLTYQRNELTEHHIYTRLARAVREPQNRAVLERIAADELRHSRLWARFTGQEVRPNWLKVWFYALVGQVLGITFAVKLMEQGEEGAQENYAQMEGVVPDVEAIAQDEKAHEEALLAMLDEERLRYTGSIVLGLNDALVELTGALAGLTFALQNTSLVAMTGAITGIAAALSMGASEYLSTKAEEDGRNPLRASLYTGVAYIFTVLALILPYLLLKNPYLCLATTLTVAVLIIAFFNYYVSVARDLPFRRRFLEMAGLSLAVAAISFAIGILMRTVFGIEI